MEENNTKRSKKIIIIVGIALVVIIAAVVTTLYIINKDQNKPEEVLNAYIDCLKNKDYEGMYALISDSTKERVDKDTYIARNKNIFEGIEATNIEISNVSSNIDRKASNYSVSYNMSFDTLAGNLAYSYTMTFDRQDDNKYYINWYSNLIFHS